MVTFTSDYWAPALDVHVRRRMSVDKGFQFAPSSTLKGIISADLTGTSTRSSSDSSGSWDYPHVSAAPRKFKKFTKFFHHHDSHSSSTSPPESPVFDDGDHDPSTPSTDKRNLKGLLIPKVGGRSSSKKGETSTSPENSFLKKYGVCEKGCIGKGATAVVRLAHKMDSKNAEEKLYAIKEFRKRRKNESEKEYIKKLTSEFCISSTLHHPNVVETVDLIQDEHQNYCTVMEYCPGGDLYNIIKSGHMSSVDIDCCFKQLIQGVAYLHSMGVAHRDLKPENLLLDHAGHLKITDFGVSDVFRMCWESQSHLSKGLCGSEPYIAPEEFEEKEYSAQAVDIWSCGIVYYCMAFQGIPFKVARPDDSNFQHYLETRKSKSYEPFEKLAPGCRNLMYRILDPDVRKRATIQYIMDDEWFKSIEVCNGYDSEHHHVLNTALPPLNKSKH